MGNHLLAELGIAPMSDYLKLQTLLLKIRSH